MKTIAEQIEDINFYDFLNKLKRILRGQNSTFISDAPTDGNTYARKDAEWVEQTASSGIESITGDFVNNTDPLNPIIEDPRTYKVYTALLSQSGTNAPVAVVLENTLGFIPVWTRNAEGNYGVTEVNGYPLDKTTLMVTSYPDSDISGVVLGGNEIQLETYSKPFSSLKDGILDDTTIEIRVYS